MKKVFAILFVAGMASLAACTSKTEEAVDSTAAHVDSVATAAATTVDSAVTAAADSVKAKVDSVVKK